MAHDYSTGDKKRGTKGIPHSIPLHLEHFRAVLYKTSEENHTVSFNSLTLNKQKSMCRTLMFKQGLSDIFIKLAVADDRISCSPLKVDDEYI